MTAIRKTAITTIVAAAFAASLSGAAMADQQQTQTNNPQINMTTQGGDNTSANTAATINAVNTYLLWKKHCKDNLLPRCEK